LLPPDLLHGSAERVGRVIKIVSAELDNFTPELRVHPVVLEVRWQIYAKAKRWDACIELSKTLTNLVPTDANNWVHLAYSKQQFCWLCLKRCAGD
jgi:hypothetical protein